MSRSPRQAQLRRFLRGCATVPFTAEIAHQVGAVAGRSATPDVVDVHVVIVDAAADAPVVTSDKEGIERVAASMEPPVTIIVI